MPFRPNLDEIEKSYAKVLAQWQQIDDQLEKSKVGRKDTPFDTQLMENMLSAWEYIDYFIKKKDYSLLSNKGGPDMLEINHRVHYGVDAEQRAEYKKAIKATTEKFSKQVLPIRNYYKNKIKNKHSIDVIASEIFIATIGQPQLYIEGNHRSGSIVASWINLEHNKPPFVLSVDNALAFFRPAQEIKKFNKRSMWRSLTKLPKHKNDFKKFWVNYCDMRFASK
ncbi:MAG: hypothetical protein KJO32_17810 [Deltaproteobacteria bacterium]|nr:hypothetical protein [Deltaproteobacteria bacterium]